MEFGKGNKRVQGNYNLGNKQLSKTDSDKDFGVTVLNYPSSEQHIISEEVHNLVQSKKITFFLLR